MIGRVGMEKVFYPTVRRIGMADLDPECAVKKRLESAYSVRALERRITALDVGGSAAFDKSV